MLRAGSRWAKGTRRTIVLLIAGSLPRLGFADKRWQSPAVSVDVGGETFMVDGTRAMFMEQDKVIYCPLQKCASEDWLHVLIWLDSGAGSLDGVVNDFGRKKYPRGFPSLDDYTLATQQQLLTSPDVVKFVILRDPAERLLAIWRNKCFKTKDDGTVLPRTILDSRPYPYSYHQTCDIADSYPQFLPPGMTLEELERPENEAAWEGVKEAILAGYARDPIGMFRMYARNHMELVVERGCYLDGHFRPPRCSCGLDVLYDSYVKIPFHSMDTAVDLVFGDNYVGSSPERKEYIREVVREHFSVNDEQAFKVTNTSSDAVREYYTPELLDLTRLAYAMDYELFGKEFFYTSEEVWEGW